jgi:type I restriction enzyme S subunit|tara:strand:+ start:7310 stop:8755 length:1446 start_codon:yes stop_codon:yes gene_type:complete
MAIRARLTAPRETREEWLWHEVESTSLPASFLFAGDRRMEAENFLAPGFAIRHAITSKDSGWTTFSGVARTWQPSRLKGIQVASDYGTPFLAATQVFDVRPVPRKWLSLNRTNDHAQRYVHEGTILLTCSGSVGRATLADKSIADILISHDLLRIDVREERMRGWVYAYLRSPTIRAMMTSAQYGHMIKHLEVSHLDALPFIEIPDELLSNFTQLTNDVVRSRDRAHDLVHGAEKRFEEEVGAISDLVDGAQGFTTSASAIFGKGRRFEGYYHNPVARSAEEAIAESGHRLERLSDLVDRVFIPGRFKHVYGPDGRPYLDSAQILEVSPDIDKRVLSLDAERRAGYLVEAGTLLLPCSGQLHGIIGSVVLAGEWHEGKVLTNHILRIVPKDQPKIRIGYLQAVLSHPRLGRPRVLRGAFGSSVPELSVLDINNMTVPRLSATAEDAIADDMEEAATLMAHANSVEDDISERAEKIVQKFLA